MSLVFQYPYVNIKKVWSEKMYTFTIRPTIVISNFLTTLKIEWGIKWNQHFSNGGQSEALKFESQWHVDVKVRYTTKYDHSAGCLVVKMTDDVVCLQVEMIVNHTFFGSIHNQVTLGHVNLGWSFSFKYNGDHKCVCPAYIGRANNPDTHNYGHHCWLISPTYPTPLYPLVIVVKA